MSSPVAVNITSSADFTFTDHEVTVDLTIGECSECKRWIPSMGLGLQCPEHHPGKCCWCVNPQLADERGMWPEPYSDDEYEDMESSDGY